VVHPQSATEPALAACAAGKQGKFKKMYDDIWTKAYAKRDFKPETMEKIAKEAGLDMGKYKTDKDGVCKKEVAQDQADLRAVGTSGTPAFYINGRFLSGARPVAQFKTLVDEELKKANAAIGKNGLTAANYYQKTVMEKGKKKL
jgi:predicted DsbA family dithiol-disulfide isomerase